ncbi:uncharacterized protein N7469_000302 [Penicillium citrinum]|uniref:Hydrophobin n=2 Tax=Penicillium TaxID=5073 RepID=A0A9W9TWG6_PENCI|nr:uncharacterized protein N7469_000302 [Penicillium citrinum]KAJ5241975.1 hypothetical protein N7469_000302 [Penicillium citrinum]KAJ5600534.1 hypothetical protein N7450_001601 [Penicillium hetheringtonii]
MPWLLLQALSALLLLRTGTRVQAKEVCTFGNAACCTIFKNEEEKSLLDFDLLKDGLVKKLIGHEDSACMSFDLIGQINILGFASSPHEEPYCNQTAACCSGHECHAIGAIDGK